ncbi:MAG: hypothetical protein GQ564_14360 [Bacteroidales bacterium]|nr:hypothetical protein [Bacteroidales bacterium]
MLNTLIEKIDDKIDAIKIENYDKDLSEVDFPVSWTFYFYLERYSSFLKSSKQLLIKFDEFPMHEMSLGLILRTMILDSLTIFELLSGANSKDDVKPKLNKLLIDNVIHYFKNFDGEDGLKNDLKNKLEAKFGSLLTQLGVTEIDELIKNPRQYSYKSPSKIYNTVKSSKYKKFAQGYDLYLHYSKYEHFGLISPLMSKIKNDKKLEILIIGYNYIFDVIDFIMKSVDD